MAGLLSGNPSHNGIMESSPYRSSHDKHDEDKTYGASWYYNRKEIEENAPSRKDGIDLKKEAYLRKSYCTFLQDLGMRLKVPQVTIATAIMFCHRFFLRQSHAKNDRRTIATVCMFLAGKVEETPRPLKDVILVSYEIIHKKDPAAIKRIKQKEVYEQQKELILIGERLILATLGFDLNVHHPYKPLVEAIKKFKVAQNALAQVAWNFVNDGLRTSLCLQFKPHHIAAGAIFLAAKFLKVKLPSDGGKVWWQEFDVTPRQLEEVSNQMLELYEQNRVGQPSHGNETEGSSASVVNHRPTRTSADNGPSGSQNEHSQASKAATSIPSTVSTCSVPDQFHQETHNRVHGTVQNDNHEYTRHEPRAGLSDNRTEAPVKDRRFHEPGKNTESSGSRSHHDIEHQQGRTVAPSDGIAELKEKNYVHHEGSKDYSPMMDAIKKIDKDKVKAALEKRRKSRDDVTKKLDLMDEDDLIERELEHGLELAVEDERNKQDRSHSWSKLTYKHELHNTDRVIEDVHHEAGETENTEEGELSLDSQEFQSPDQSTKKRKAASPGKHLSGKDEYDPPHHHSSSSKHRDDGYEDLRPMGI